jgi:hypothetical protein
MVLQFLLGWVVKNSCVVSLADIYFLCNLIFNREKKWETDDWMIRFWEGMLGDL